MQPSSHPRKELDHSEMCNSPGVPAYSPPGQARVSAALLDDANYRMKPMNCPFHILIYRDSLKSYRDLPVRLGELGTVYRYERSGVMHDLLRVRSQERAEGSVNAEAFVERVKGLIEGKNAMLL